MSFFAFLGIVLFACKSKKTKENCTSANCVQIDTTSLKNSCLTQLGAKWNEQSKKCLIPKNDNDCTSTSSNFTWDGEKCVSASDEMNFYRLCNDDKQSDAIKDTLKKISRDFPKKNCQEIFSALRGQSEIIFNNYEISELKPLKFFTQLKSLNLWNNKISDLTPLSELKGLSKIDLGHNAISTALPLAALTQLNWVNLSENKLTDTSGLENLPLDYLDLSRNLITDFGILKEKTFKIGFFTSGNPL